MYPRHALETSLALKYIYVQLFSYFEPFSAKFRILFSCAISEQSLRIFKLWTWFSHVSSRLKEQKQIDICFDFDLDHLD